MEKCPNCQEEIESHFFYCPYCGFELKEHDVIYHYTSIETLNAILSGCEHHPTRDAKSDSIDSHRIKLWATHWMYLNDPTEYKYFFDELRDYIRDNKDLCTYRDSFDSTFDFAKRIGGMPYVISLSKAKDNLEMWRSYAGNGTGVAIGFDKNRLYAEICKTDLDDKYNSVKMYDCRYLEKDQIKNECNKLRDYLLSVLSKSEKNGGDYNLIHLVESLIVFKHPCYFNEREARIVLFDYSPVGRGVKFRTVNDLIIPYREVSIPISCIREIILGPCADVVKNKESISMKLTSKNSKLAETIYIDHSPIPYRQI